VTTVLFACVHNAGRSQMAAAWFRALADPGKAGAVSAGTPARVPIPASATSFVIAFSATPGITGAPVRRDELSGTVTDQDPPSGRILIQLFLKPATR